MDNRASIARLLTDLDTASQGGFAIALHIRSHSPTFLFQTFPVAWVEYYHNNGLVMKDPAMHWAFANTGFIRWRDLKDSDPNGVMASAKRHGLNYGFTASIHNPSTRSLAGFTRTDRDFLDVEIEEILGLLTQLNRVTADIDHLSNEDSDALQDISVRVTRGFG